MPRRRGWREKRLSKIRCAKGSHRTIRPRAGINVVICCPKGHWRRSRCNVSMKATAELKKS